MNSNNSAEICSTNFQLRTPICFGDIQHQQYIHFSIASCVASKELTYGQCVILYIVQSSDDPLLLRGSFLKLLM